MPGLFAVLKNSSHRFTDRQPRSLARREQRVPSGKRQPGPAPPASQVMAAPQAAVPARSATTVSTLPPVQPLE
jgi:hypothetical protein